jgi:hypothetical protein
MANRPVINKVEARQGSTKPGLRYVLIGGLVLVIIAFLLVAKFA